MHSDVMILTDSYYYYTCRPVLQRILEEWHCILDMVRLFIDQGQLVTDVSSMTTFDPTRLKVWEKLVKICSFLSY